MNESNFIISGKNLADFESGHAHLAIDVTGGPIQIWPSGVRTVASGSYRVCMQIKDGLLTMALRREGDPIWEVLVENVPSVFAHADGVVQVLMEDDQTTAVVNLEDMDGTAVVDGVTLQSGQAVSRYVTPKPMEVNAGRICVRVKVIVPSQLCLDLFHKSDPKPFAGIVIEHDPAGHANVWRDIMEGGLYIRDKREKMGFFEWKESQVYRLGLTMMPGSEEGSGRVGVYVTGAPGANRLFTMSSQEKGLIPGHDTLDYVQIRETGQAGMPPGRYEFEQIG